MAAPRAGLALLVAGLAGLAGCEPGGVRPTDALCARAAMMYDQCEDRGGVDAQGWEIILDRWRGLCRAAFTGETAQLLPNALALWHELPDDVRAGLREQAACSAGALTCPQYHQCQGEPAEAAPAPPPRRAPLLVPGG